MDDLFADIEERAAIKEFDGLIPKEQAEAQARHECEVIWCIRNFYPDGQAMKSHFELVEKKRGKPATDMLRSDVRKAWQARKDAE
jgi:hypothetical protein